MNQDESLTVSEINDLIRSLVDDNIGIPMYVNGEIYNLKKSNNNLYFTLKDDQSAINAIFWKGGNNNFNNGDKVIIFGKITFYTKMGTYQITCENIKKSGSGDIFEKYNMLKKELEDKSYFSKKRPFPNKINNIAILTSIEGSVIQDILYVLNTYKYKGTIYIKNCQVQGPKCPSSVREGIEYFNNNKNKFNIDVLIIARGGGGIDDLIGYSSEEVVKAIYNSDIFTISAIGHETDTMFSDLASDYRAPTPSISAETLIKHQKKELDVLLNYQDQVKNQKYIIATKLQSYLDKLNNLQNIAKLRNPKTIIEDEIAKLKNLQSILKNNISQKFDQIVGKLNDLKAQNNTSKIIKKGYVLITDHDGNIIENVKDFQQLYKKQSLVLHFHDGNIDLKI